jgi:hypothetical protein
MEGGEDPRGGGRLREFETESEGLRDGGSGSAFRKSGGWVKYFLLV